MIKLLQTRRFQKKAPGTGRRPAAQGGFTIAELIVVIAIFTIITSIALFDQGNLNSNVLLTNIAYETALAVREAQVYGLGVQNSGDPTNGFLGDYGAHYDTTSIESSRQIIVYANGTNSLTRGYYAGEEKYIYEFTNQRGNKIAYLCLGPLTDSGGTPHACDPTDAVGVGIIKPSMDIVFKRPEPGPVFYTPTDTDGSNPGPAYIVVTTLDGSNCKVVVVNKTGQISVEGPSSGHCKIH